MNRVELQHLSVGYPSGRTVLTDMSATFCGGRLTCLIGDNGTGKSTLIRTLAGLTPPLAGQILIGDRPVTGLRPKEMARLVSVVLTDTPRPRRLSVRETVALGRLPYTGFLGRLTDADRKAVGKAIRATGLSDMAGRQVSQLSDGERQKVMIAKALAQETEVIYLDEPTAFLDYGSRIAMMRLLRQLAVTSGKVMLMSTHDLPLALRIADEFWQTGADGRLRQVTKKDIIKQYETDFAD